MQFLIDKQHGVLLGEVSRKRGATHLGTLRKASGKSLSKMVD